jgi:hypothetical protein
MNDAAPQPIESTTNPANGKTAEAELPLPQLSYVPKDVFFTEFYRVAPAWMKGEDVKAWEFFSQNEHHTEGRVLAPAPLESFRMMVRSMIHGYVSIELGQLMREHSKQADALRTIAFHELRDFGKSVECATYDIGSGMIRECKHEDEGPSMKAIEIPLAGPLGDLLRKIITR